MSQMSAGMGGAGGGGDMALTATLSTAQVEASLARLEGAMRQSSARINGAFDRAQRQLFGVNRLAPAAIAGVTASFAIGRKSLLDYAEKNDEVKRKVETLGAVWGRVWDNIGRDIANSGALEYLTDLGRAVDDYQTGLQVKSAEQLGRDAGRSVMWGWLASMTHGPAATPFLIGANAKATQEVSAAVGAELGDGNPYSWRLIQEQADRTERVRSMLERLGKRIGANVDRAAGLLDSAQRLEMEIAGEEAQIEAAKAFPDDRDVDARAAYVELTVGETAARHAAENARRRAAGERSLKDRAEAERRDLEENDRAVRDRNAAWERGRVRSEADAAFMEREAAIAVMRAEGREREAEAAALTLKYDRERKALELDEGLADFDKRGILDRINRAEAIERAVLGTSTVRVVGARSLGGGLGGLGFDARVFGSGPKVNDAQRELLNVQKGAAETLKRIEQKITAGATFR